MEENKENFWAKKIKRALALTEMTQKVLAEKLGIKQGTLAQWTSGRRRPSLGTLRRISAALEVPLDFFTSEKDETISEYLKRISLDMQFMPVKGTSSATTEQVMWEDNETFIRFPKTGENQFAIKVEGNCMVNPKSPRDSIFDGDYIIVDPDVPAESGDVVLARICKEFSTIKRMFIHTDKIVLKPDNPDCRKLEKNPEDVEIIGKVVNISRSMRKIKEEE
ncbi:MAG: helix-turn-helix domain-containing protein [Elusimicrobiaceae bacterium]|nr:helix-turn-helix domain-containing protein [Elusimicrobiaceae bacterium]